MANEEQEPIGKGPPSFRGSNRMASVCIEEENPPTISKDNMQQEEPKRPERTNFLLFIGPGFLMSLAYLDPSNLEADLQAGASHRYQLLWVILIGLIFALVIQSLSANLGVATGKHLSEICRLEYPPYLNYCLWLMAEAAVTAADIPEVIGTAFSLNILFHIPVWTGVLLTGTSALLLLGLQRFGARKLELLIAIFVFVMAGCYYGELGYVKPPVLDMLKGIFIPNLKGKSTTGDTVALIGSIVTPHNLFLHSALVLSRKIPQSAHEINNACRYFLIESGFALFLAFLINVAVISVAGTVCFAPNISNDISNQCSNLTVDSASFLIKNVLGGSTSTIYGIALFASGQSSTITGTYAGQFIMQGFLGLTMKKWKRNLMTRCIAITPSLVVSIIGGSSSAGRLIIIASMIQLFELPFSLIPLLKFSNSRKKMGPHKNSIYVMVIAWIIGFCIVVINVYFLSTSFVTWLIHNSLPKLANIFIGIFVFPLMALYILAVIYLTFRKDKAITFVDTDPELECVNSQTQIENGLSPATDLY
ncbi:metal transporter Nramp7.2-like isoform X1 [Tasmannia lanceolata]|uniref:metal transporter Nramp7.2-like isoform X1 n=1 Tax=Tasmannia lanceolata TaxID=3420 RepID=UPI0040638306